MKFTHTNAMKWMVLHFTLLAICGLVFYHATSVQAQSPTPVNTKPAMTSMTLVPSAVTPDGVSTYTLTSVATDSYGGNTIKSMGYYLNAGTPQRGLGMWSLTNTFTPPWTAAAMTGVVACTGTNAGFAGEYGAAPATYPIAYLSIASCSTSVSGNERTVNIVFKFNPIFTTPASNNFYGIAYDSLGLSSAPWAGPYATFSLFIPSPTPIPLASCQKVQVFKGVIDITTQMNLIRYGDQILFRSIIPVTGTIVTGIEFTYSVDGVGVSKIIVPTRLRAGVGYEGDLVMTIVRGGVQNVEVTGIVQHQ